MFRVLDPNIRRRAREVVSFFSGKHAQLFHAKTMLTLFDENGVGEPEWLWPSLNTFLEEPVGLRLNEKFPGYKVDSAGRRRSDPSALLLTFG
jgi:hypothetical protein